MEEIKRFKEVFWEAFYRPKFKSEKFQKIWEELENLNNWLSGPLFAIYENGHCDYVFQDKKRFPTVADADDLLDWFSAIIKEYKEGISQKPESEEESLDLQTLAFQLDMKMELADLAYHIQKKRA